MFTVLDVKHFALAEMIDRNYQSTAQNFFDDAREMFTEEAVRVEYKRSNQYARFLERNPQLDPLRQLSLILSVDSGAALSNKPTGAATTNGGASAGRSLSLSPQETGAIPFVSMPAHATSLPALAVGATSEPSSPSPFAAATPTLSRSSADSAAQLLAINDSFAQSSSQPPTDVPISASGPAATSAVLPEEHNVPLSRPTAAHSDSSQQQQASRTLFTSTSRDAEFESRRGFLFQPLLLLLIAYGSLLQHLTHHSSAISATSTHHFNNFLRILVLIGY